MSTGKGPLGKFGGLWECHNIERDGTEVPGRHHANGTENIAHICKALDCKMTYISID